MTTTPVHRDETMSLRLDSLLDKKVERDRLSASKQDGSVSPQAAAVSGGKLDEERGAGETPSAPAARRVCWLCDRTVAMRFRILGNISLCFKCFRTSYLVLVLPIMDTPARRESDAAFLKQIYSVEEERTASMSATGDDSLFSTYGEIVEPQNVSFVMSATKMRRRREEEEQQRRAVASKSSRNENTASSLAGARSYWSCPRCTFLNAALARACEACDFVNPGSIICPVCKGSCTTNLVSASSMKIREVKKCSNGEPHCIWNCRECGGLNTLDGDRCTRCREPRYWACSQCTALHHMARGEDGLRYCPTCGAYNTPDDVMQGQAKIDKEAGFAEMVTAQRAAERRRSSQGDHTKEIHSGDAISADTNEIVFGVNDADTLEEVARQRQIEENEKRLVARLQRLRITRNKHNNDGNCLFSALANQLFGMPRLHNLVRSLAVAYMDEHPSDYAVLFSGVAEWKAYQMAMKEPGTWGDELCLNAVARCFRVNIHVITSEESRWHIVFQYQQLSKSILNRDGGSGGAANKSSGPSNSEAALMSSPKRKAVASPGPPPFEGVSLFLSYLSPVHYDDISPSPVKPIMLSELLRRELHQSVERRQSLGGIRPGETAASPKSQSPAPAPAPSSPVATRSRVWIADAQPRQSSRLPSTGSLAGPAHNPITFPEYIPVPTQVASSSTPNTSMPSAQSSQQNLSKTNRRDEPVQPVVPKRHDPR